MTRTRTCNTSIEETLLHAGYIDVNTCTMYMNEVLKYSTVSRTTIYFNYVANIIKQPNEA